jgi:N-acetyl-gamma-glutamyl-phosphate reductase
MSHACPEWVSRAAYGLPEMYRKQIADARLVANPGCYPTAVQLGFLPLLEAGLVRADRLIADCKSGVTGAGRGASIANLMAETADSFRAYAVDGHRHLPEIEQGLAQLSATPVSLTFTPHVLPIIRGIQATLYAELLEEVDLQALYEARFANEPFVDVLPAGVHPDTRSVRGTNMCRLSVFQPQNRDMAVVLAVEDNLVKGAAGQAVQNMNLMLGLPETRGLQQPALLP